nr:hypothetical protein DLTAUQXX_DLTAUQXX_CDS_0050 [uncultured phage]CAI9750146.1 hypothetical protein LUIDIZRK_LUIDIZRK_CDS_0050 [uncultured phage]
MGFFLLWHRNSNTPRLTEVYHPFRVYRFRFPAEVAVCTHTP